MTFGVFAGFKQLSLLRLLCQDFFYSQVGAKVGAGRQRRVSVAGSALAAPRESVGLEDLLQIARSSSGRESPPFERKGGADEPVAPSALVRQLAKMYGWAAEAFAALDLDKSNTIHLHQHAPIISRALCEGGLRHLWTILEETSGADDALTHTKFLFVFFAWMGIDDALEARLRSGTRAPMVQLRTLHQHAATSCHSQANSCRAHTGGVRHGPAVRLARQRA